MYWVAQSSESGEEMVEKWKSVTNHVVNIHTHDSALYPRCQHDDIEREWMQECKTQPEILKSILQDTCLNLKDPTCIRSYYERSYLYYVQRQMTMRLWKMS